MDDYRDIINLPHHVSTKHPRMSLEQRSAQFAPYSALTGYDGQVRESARLTDKKIELDEEVKLVLDRKLQVINDMLQMQPEVTITYFSPDNKKSGGKYEKVTGGVLKIDEFNNSIVLANGKIIDISEIIDIQGEILKKFEN